MKFPLTNFKKSVNIYLGYHWEWYVYLLGETKLVRVFSLAKMFSFKVEEPWELVGVEGHTPLKIGLEKN